MEVTLRPLSLGEILDRTFQVYRSRFLMFAGIASFAAGIDLVWKLIQTSALRMVQTHVAVTTLGLVSSGFSLINLVVYTVASAVAMAATCRAVSALYLGQETGIGQAYREVKPRALRFVWLYISAMFLAWAPAVAAFIILILASVAIRLSASTAGALGAGLIAILMALSFLVILPFGVWMMLRYSLANPACVFEDLKVGASLKRSIALSKGRKGSILVMAFLVWIISLILTYALAAPVIVSIVRMVMHQAPLALSLGVTIYTLLVGFVVTSITLPLYSIGLTLFYFDQRIRMEGFDVEWMLQQASPVAAAPVEPPAPTLPAEPAGQA